MPERARWGHPHIGARDWIVYNERLVKLGEFYLSLEFIDQWDAHLARMNSGKRDLPFQ